MSSLIQTIKNEYKNKKKFIIRLIVSIIVSPVEIFIILLGLQFGVVARMQVDFLMQIKMDSTLYVISEHYLMYWLISLSIFFIHFFVYWFNKEIFKIRIHFEIIVGMTIVSSALLLGLSEPPPSGFVLKDFMFTLAIPTIFAYIQYLIFLFLLVIGKTVIKLKTKLQYPLSCILSIFFSYIITRSMWPIILFNYTH